MQTTVINWNALQDPFDLEIWNKLVSQFWIDTKIPLSNDLKSWSEMTEAEKLTTKKVFVGLTALDSIQSLVGAPTLQKYALTDHEEHVLNNIAFMESVHAKSYSSIFSTLCSNTEIAEMYAWGDANNALQTKGRMIEEAYHSGDIHKIRIASTLLESFLFYSGFFWPLYLSGRKKLTNTSDLIKLIIKDECLVADHELLTPNGWKKVSEVTLEDRVAQYQDEDSGIVFVNPVNISSHEAPYVWDFESEQGHVRQVVSGNHRMYLERRPYGKGTEHSSEIVRADDLPQSRLNGYARFVNAGYKQGGRDTITAEERLLIAISADGSFNTSTVNTRGVPRRNGTVTGRIPCSFSFSKERKIARLQMLAEEAGWELLEGSTYKAGGNTKDKRNFRLMVPVGVDRSKLLSRVSELEGVSYLWAQEFIEELSLWDGHIVKANPENITWGSVIRDNAEYVQAVAALAGYRTHFRKIEDDRSETFSDYYRVQINKGNRYSGAQRVVKTKGEGRTMYGVEVPSGLLLTRNQGSVTVTGNSVHGLYIGYKHKQAQKPLSPELREEYKQFTHDLLQELFDNEMVYTRELYDELNLTSEVATFLKYNANKAMENLGYEHIYKPEETRVMPSVMAVLSPGGDNHDFFSGAGSSYQVAKKVTLSDDDFDY